MKYPTQLDPQREVDSIMYLLYIVITYISCRDDEERSDITHLCCSGAWVGSLHSPSCGVKGFALILGSTERDFQKLALEVRFLPRLGTVSAESDGVCTNKAQTLGASPPPSHYQTDVSRSSLSECLWRVGISLWLGCDCCEQISWAHITTIHPHVATYLFKFVFTSLFLLCVSHICFVLMETAAGLHPSCGAVITVWTRRFPFLFVKIQHMKFI